MYQYLNRILSPDDIKKLAVTDLPFLANEIRHALLLKISEVGGHLGPNFGVVEVTIAMHYVFNSPIDKFVFDVSHQSYVHKMLTGRKDAFIVQDKYNDVTGFSNPAESEHDFFTIGHTSTSISLACGLAKARDTQGGKENIIAFIGDGALSGGEAFEGLNCGGEMGTNLIVIVNDNDMAIAEAHGALTKHLAELRSTNGKSQNNFFKSLGYEYFYVPNGNDVEKLIDTLQQVKDSDHPILVHINTKKGQGYKVAEENKEAWHYHLPFDPKTGNNIQTFTSENYDDITAQYLINKIRKDPSVVLITPAVPMTVGFNAQLRKDAGLQYIDVGIAEEHAISMAAGIARNGGKPIVATHSTFYQRVYDQVSQELCINKCAATLLVRNGSVWGAKDETHLGFFDVAIFSNIPNLVYLAPTNCEEYLAMLDWSIEQNEYPVAIRIPRNGVHHANRPVDIDYSKLNTAVVERIGSKVAIIAVGDFFQMGEKLSDVIACELGFIPTLINPRFMTGLDEKLLESLKYNHQVVISMEDGIIDGGYGQKIAGYYSTTNIAVISYGLKKEFLDGYNPAELLEENGIKNDLIIKRLREILLG